MYTPAPAAQCNWLTTFGEQRCTMTILLQRVQTLTVCARWRGNNYCNRKAQSYGGTNIKYREIMDAQDRKRAAAVKRLPS